MYFFQAKITSSTGKQPMSQFSTSTPIKTSSITPQPDICNVSAKSTKDQATIVGLSPKVKTPQNLEYDVTKAYIPKSPQPISKKSPSPILDTKSKEKKTPPSPLPKPPKTKFGIPLSPIAKNKSHIPVSKDRTPQKNHGLFIDKTPSPSSSIESPLTPNFESKFIPASPLLNRESELKKLYGDDADTDLIEFETEALQMMRRMDVMLLTVGGVDNERDPGKRLEVSYMKIYT